jgi:hypothetical protein
MLEMALSDPALLHGCIMLAANHWVLLGGDLARVASAFYSHKIGALRLINERLGSIDTAKRDGTVGSIACLVLAEVGKSLLASYHQWHLLANRIVWGLPRRLFVI